MKKLSLLLFSILMIFSMCVDAEAFIVTGEGFSGSGISVDVKTVKHSLPGNKEHTLLGVRISFVTSDGTQLSSSDYVLRYPLGSMANYDAAVSTLGTNRVTYLKNGMQPAFSQTLGSIKSNQSLSNLFSKHNFTIDLSLPANTVANHAYKVSNASEWFNRSHYTGSNYENDLKALLREFLPTYDLDNEESVKNLFFIIEPTTLFEIRKVEYYQDGVLKVYKPLGEDVNSLYVYGTLYELANLAVGVPDWSASAGAMVNALNGTFYTVSRRNMPCSGYLKGEILSDISAAGVSGFGSSYFGVLSPLSSSEEAICHRSEDSNGQTRFDSSVVTGGTKAVGISIVWFYDKLTFDDMTCDKVHEIAGTLRYDPNNLVSCNSYKTIVDNYMSRKSPTDKNIDYNWYKTNCGCEPITPPSGEYNCTPDIDVNTCSSSSTTSVEYSDSENWDKCIFNDAGYYSIDIHKTAADGALTYYESGLGNKYCSVYCREELTATFDKNVGVVKAGTNFVWPKNAQVNGSRTCKTKSIDFNRYLRDVEYANAVVKNSYIALKTAEKRNELIDSQKSAVQYSSSSCGLVHNAGGDPGCISGEYVPDKIYHSAWDQPQWGFNEDGEWTIVGSIHHDGWWENTTKWECTGGYSDKRFDYYPSRTGTVNISSEYGGNYSNPVNVSSYCSNQTGNTKQSLYQLQIDYTKAVSDAEAVAKNIKNCYTWDNDSVYNTADTELTISYNDAQYVYNDELSKVDVDYNSSNDDDCVSYNTNVLKCSGDSCSYDTVPVKKCGYYSKTVSAEQKFELKSGTYQYVLKGEDNYSNKSIHANQLSSYLTSGNINYVNIGYPNLPVSYRMRDAQYDISLTYSKLGHGESSYRTALDSIMGAYSEDYGNWSCKYTVVSELIPEDTIHAGIDVIYRPIDLNNPFPGKNGNGRIPGENWKDVNIDTIITNSIPDEPMYSFTLTPSIIKQIRAYNRNNSYDDFKLTCEARSGKACVSEFINNLIVGDYGNANANGTCTNSSARNSTTSNFYGC